MKQKDKNVKIYIYILYMYIYFLFDVVRDTNEEPDLIMQVFWGQMLGAEESFQVSGFKTKKLKTK